MIIATFKTEKELFEDYPKVKFFKMRDIFNDYWDSLLLFSNSRNLTIRDVVKRDVERMMVCCTSLLGGTIYKCPHCGHTKLVCNTCKSRFCNSCGIKYAKQRALNIESK